MPPKSNSEVVKKKLSLALVKAKIVRFLISLFIEEGINPKDADFARYGGSISGRVFRRLRLDLGQVIDYLNIIFSSKSSFV